MELETQRVWDYTGDNYVHRLVQNKSDGKLVEFGVPPGEVASDEKLDSMTLEYTYLLTSQLESQRLYFEEKIAFVEKDAFQQMEAVVEKSKKSLEECQKYERMFSDSEKERKSLEKKNSHCATKLKSLEKELQDEKQMNECLRNNQKIWQEKVVELERHLKEVEAQRQTEVTELQEQVGDLMRHFEAQAAIEKAPADLQQEIQEGQMFVPQNQARASHKPKRKHK
jgi:BRCA1-associated protein